MTVVHTHWKPIEMRKTCLRLQLTLSKYHMTLIVCMTTQGRIDLRHFTKPHRGGDHDRSLSTPSATAFHRSLTVVREKIFNKKTFWDFFLIELFSRRCNGTEIPKNPKNTSHEKARLPSHIATYTELVSNRHSIALSHSLTRTYIFMNELEKYAAYATPSMMKFNDDKIRWW